MDTDLIRSPGSDPRDQIVLALRRSGVLSRAEIARATRLAPSTVSESVSELVQSGIVVATATVRKPLRSGRPGTGLTLNPAAGNYVGVDFGFRHVRSVVADVSHEVLATAEISVEEDYSLEHAMAVASDVVNEAIDAAGITRESVLGIGAAIPGPFDEATGTVIGTSMVPTWSGADLRSVLVETFDQDVIVDNESNCSALAEHLWGAGRGSRVMVYLKLHSGVGGAIVMDGELVRGVAGAAGEFGHISVDPSGPLCRCGGRGCLEAYIGIPALLEELRPRFGRSLSLSEMLELAKNGDLASRRALTEATEMAGRALGVICNVLAPQLIVVGGALAEAGPLVLDPLRASLATHAVVSRCMPAPQPRIKLAAGTLGRNASALGAVALVLTRLGLERKP